MYRIANGMCMVPIVRYHVIKGPIWYKKLSNIIAIRHCVTLAIKYQYYRKKTIKLKKKRSSKFLENKSPINY